LLFNTFAVVAHTYPIGVGVIEYPLDGALEVGDVTTGISEVDVTDADNVEFIVGAGTVIDVTRNVIHGLILLFHDELAPGFFALGFQDFFELFIGE
jgi:hypothetical protein